MGLTSVIPAYVLQVIYIRVYIYCSRRGTTANVKSVSRVVDYIHVGHNYHLMIINNSLLFII